MSQVKATPASDNPPFIDAAQGLPIVGTNCHLSSEAPIILVRSGVHTCYSYFQKCVRDTMIWKKEFKVRRGREEA